MSCGGARCALADDAPRWHALTAAEVAERLEVDPSRGLGRSEAGRRLAEHGPNAIDTGEGRSRLDLLIDQFRDVLVWILVGAAVVSGTLLGDLVDAAVIGAIVVLNALIGYLQEARAEDALARLQELSAPEATVVREGATEVVAAADLVPGDVLLLSQGDRVPADARVVEAARLELDESPLTGESLPVRKHPDPVDPESGVGDRRCIVFSGTAVAAGRGRAVVVGTGEDTEMGTIAELLDVADTDTPLQVELARVGRRIAVLAGVAAVLVFGLGALRDLPVESLLLTAVALAVAAIPEGLPAVTTITLARGVRAMADRNAIVRRLPAVEALGAATVICTDKTGTLTQNRMRVTDLATGQEGVRDLDEVDPQMVRSSAAVAVLCSNASRSDEGWEGDATEVALVASMAPRFVDAEEVRERFPRVDEAPFDSSRKRMSTLHRDGEGWLLAVKGAPEVILPRCTAVVTPEGGDLPLSRPSAGTSPAGGGDGAVSPAGGGEGAVSPPEGGSTPSGARGEGGIPLDDEGRRRFDAAAEELAAEGLRTLALAYRRLAAAPDDPADAEEELVLCGVVGMRDEIRPEAPQAVSVAFEAGIEVVMITGDHAVTARAIASELGLLRDREVLDGVELRRLGPEGLAPRVRDVGVYARVDPADKVTIVEGWRAEGGIVAMTGDGVNDAPALRNADIGVAMGSGTDVAKESADVVLSDDDFATIVAAVERGRAIFANLTKVVTFLLAANISEITVMLVGFLVFGGFGEPLLAVQLLWINLVTDGLPALALGVDPPADDLMRRPPLTDRNILSVSRQLQLAWQGAVIALGPLLLYGYGAMVRDLPWEEVRTMAFTAVVLSQLAYAFLVRAEGRPVWRSHPLANRWLVAAVIASILLQLLVVFTPVGQLLFETVLFPASEWWAVVAASLVPFLLIEALHAVGRR